jgi:hypothetical protein
MPLGFAAPHHGSTDVPVGPPALAVREGGSSRTEDVLALALRPRKSAICMCVNAIQRFAQGPWIFVVIALGQVLPLIELRFLWPLTAGLIVACVIGFAVRLRSRREGNSLTN